MYKVADVNCFGGVLYSMGQACNSFSQFRQRTVQRSQLTPKRVSFCNHIEYCSSPDVNRPNHSGPVSSMAGILRRCWQSFLSRCPDVSSTQPRWSVQGGSCRSLHSTPLGESWCVKGGSCRTFHTSMPVFSTSVPAPSLWGPTVPPASCVSASASPEIPCMAYPSQPRPQAASPSHVDEAETVPAHRVGLVTSGNTREWFTMFGTVEGHHVLAKGSGWTDLQCIAKAISHAAPALTRPSGRVLQVPLPGLFCPQVVLTRQLPSAPYQTIVFDLRPIGADLRTEDTRLGKKVDSVVAREGVLHLLLRNMNIPAAALLFAVNGADVTLDHVLQHSTETVTLKWKHPARFLPPTAPATAPSVPDEPDGEPATE